MATLNTLRTKGSVIVAVVISVSLLAFLLGDLATSGGTILGSSQMNVGEVNKNTISYNEYLDKINNITLAQQIASNQENLNEQQQEAIRNSSWDLTIRENSFDESLTNLGMIISDDEIIDMADGEFLSPIMYQLFTDPTTGMFNSDSLRRHVTTLDNDVTGRKRWLWNYIENEMTQERVMSKYISLIENSIFANNLEIENAVSAINNSYNLTFTGKSITSIADSLVTVTESDYKKYYESHKRIFRKTDAREIEYVVFETLPSTSDYENAQEHITNIAIELTETEEIGQFVNLNSNSKFIDSYLSIRELPNSIQAFALNAKKDAIFGPELVADVYTLARLIDTKNLPDTVGVRQIVVSMQSQALADSIVTEIKAKRLDFDDAVALYSLDQQTPGGNIGRVSPNQFTGFDEIVENLNNSSKGDIFIAKSPYGIHIMENTYRSNLVPKFKMGVVTYNVEPSENTIQDVYINATNFLTQAEEGDFDKAVEDNAISKRVARLNAGDSNVSNIEDSREIVRWAFASKTNDISEIISIGESNIIARVTNSIEHGHASLAEVKRDIYPSILREKKIEALSLEFKGATMAEVASNLGTEIDSVENINFNSFYIPELEVAPVVIGLMTTIAENTKSEPVVAGNKVVVINVNSKVSKEETTFDIQKVVVQTALEANVSGRAYSAVFNLANVKDSRILFF